VQYHPDHERALATDAIFRQLNEIDRRLHALSRRLEESETRLARLSVGLVHLRETLVGVQAVPTATAVGRLHVEPGSSATPMRRRGERRRLSPRAAGT
jgi:hypothetical protein